LRTNLYAAAKKPIRTVIGGKVFILHVRAFESGDAFEVSIDLAPKLDPSVVPLFTAKQGQYLAFIYNYTRSTAARQRSRTCSTISGFPLLRSTI
jgi:hypothetical protein